VTRLSPRASQFGDRAFVWSGAASFQADANAAIQDETCEKRAGDVGAEYLADRLVQRIVGRHPFESACSRRLFVLASGEARPSSWNATRAAPFMGNHGAQMCTV
jgi:hypothetical protein